MAPARRNARRDECALRTHRATRLIAETLSGLMPTARLVVVPGAGHMGPLTHAPFVNAAIARHIEACDGGVDGLSE